ncbi:MAG TPA: NUDIX domain-containing protein [Candidatus Stackebrandtia excrementipullorum]|nr:NUDIX domain-containing protein [Candidatus Stackebrandtia excrementipullorum]
MEASIRHRRAARVLLIDEHNRVLLFRGCDPRQPEDKYWFTVGGGVETGENDREAACRELYEETGIRSGTKDLVGPIYETEDDFMFAGRRYIQRQVFFVLRVIDATIDTSGFGESERATMDRYEWWSSGRLRTTRQRFFPVNLVELLDGV